MSRPTADFVRGQAIQSVAGQVGATLVATPEQLELLAQACCDLYELTDEQVVDHWVDGGGDGPV